MGRVVQAHPVLIELNALHDLGGALIIIPESGTKGELFVLGYFLQSVLDVKETSLSRQCGTAYPVIFRLSCCKGRQLQGKLNDSGPVAIERMIAVLETAHFRAIF